MKTVKKTWGTETWLRNASYCVKVLRVEPGFQCSWHCHPKKDESFYFLDDETEMEVSDTFLHPAAGDFIHVAPGTLHRFRNRGKLRITEILEISTFHDEKDVVRLEESRKINENEDE